MSNTANASTAFTPSANRICVVGLGYVGLPLACEFDSVGYDVRGYDVDTDKIRTLERGIDPTGDVSDRSIAESSIQFTTDPSVISTADYVVVAVPTPVDELEKPDLSLVERAGETVGEHLTAGTTVVLESTVYPGATRELFVPALERGSSMTAGEEFGVGYSPERIVPGDDDHGLRNVVKIVSGLTEGARANLVDLYGSIVDAGVHEAPTIETAEAAKCVENTQRDVNIALVNELAVACTHLGIDTQAVLDAAKTKWNFHDYRPGLVGGHCIPVDPFYLVYESERNGFKLELVRSAREINDYVPTHVGEMTVKTLNDAENVLKHSTVLILGLTYKPNVADLRSSIGGVIDYLREYGVSVVGYDPHAADAEIRERFGIDVVPEPSGDGFDAIVIGTPHDAFGELDIGGLLAEMNENPVLVDVDGMFEDRASEHDCRYWRL
ncbi:nucleotide sugar dehydrogenase [Saliphagus sp. GCM10025308]